MLPTYMRFNPREDKDFFRRSTRKRFPFGVLYFSPGKHFRGAVVVSKDFSPSAVERNRMKRVLRASLFSIFSSDNSGKTMDVAIVVNKRKGKESYADIARAAITALQNTI